MSTPRRSSCFAISTFSWGVKATPADCSPSRRVVSKIQIFSAIWCASSRSGVAGRWALLLRDKELPGRAPEAAEFEAGDGGVVGGRRVGAKERAPVSPGRRCVPSSDVRESASRGKYRPVGRKRQGQVRGVLTATLDRRRRIEGRARGSRTPAVRGGGRPPYMELLDVQLDERYTRIRI